MPILKSQAVEALSKVVGAITFIEGLNTGEIETVVALVNLQNARVWMRELVSLLPDDSVAEGAPVN